MINQQLVEYIKQQVAAGVAKESVRKALSDAGWAPADVDDSMKAAEPAVVAAQTVNPAVAMGGVDTTGSAVSAAKSPMATASSSEKFFSRPATSTVSQDSDDDDHPPVKKFMIAMIAMGAVIILLAGTLAFVYFNLNGQLEAARLATGGDPAQAQGLRSQITQLEKDKADLTTQNQALSVSNQDLSAELGFLAPATGTSTVPVSATVKGTLSGNASTTFMLTTAHNTKILVVNSKDAKVSAALAPLAAGTTTVILSGTHIPASTNLTVTAVNGTTL